MNKTVKMTSLSLVLASCAFVSGCEQTDSEKREQIIGEIIQRKVTAICIVSRTKTIKEWSEARKSITGNMDEVLSYQAEVCDVGVIGGLTLLTWSELCDRYEMSVDMRCGWIPAKDVLDGKT